MTDPHFHVETELRAASDDLAGSLDGAPPPFKPTPRRAPLVLALVLLVGAGGVAYNLSTRDQTAQVATPAPTTVVSAPSTIVSTAPPAEGTVASDEVNPDPIVGKDTQAADANFVKPAVGGTYIDAAYGNQVRRITGAAPGEFHLLESGYRPIENADDTALLSWAGRIGDDYWVILDRTTGSVISELSIDGRRLTTSESPHWDPTNPDLVRITGGPESVHGHLRIDHINARTGEVSVVADLTDSVQQVWPSAFTLVDRSFGAPSADGDRYVFDVLDADGASLGLLTYELSTNSILGTVGVSEENGLLRSVSMSISGDYVVVAYAGGVVVHDVDLTNPRRIHERKREMTVAQDSAGRDVVLLQSFDDPDAGLLLSIDLVSLERTALFDLYSDNGNTTLGLSGVGYTRPGWALVSTYGCSTPDAWSCNKVMLVEIAASGTIINLAHTNSCGTDGWQGRAVVNRSMTRAYFGSDGGVCGPEGAEEVGTELYEVTLPTP